MIEKAKIKVAAKSDDMGIARPVIVGVVTAIVLSLLGLLANWGYQGGLIRLLGGVSRTELPDEIEKQLSRNSQFRDGVKLEVVAGNWSNNMAKLADGNIVAVATQEHCQEGSIIIGGYCGSGPNTAGKATLLNVGLFNGKQFQCIWVTTPSSEALKLNAQAACLRVAKK